MFTLKISTDDDDLAAGGGVYSLERILREVGETIRLSVPELAAATAEGIVRDANGVRIGEWKLNAPEDELEGALSLPPEDAGTAPAPASELAALQRGDETLPFPVHIQRWPREEGEEPCDPVAFVLSLAAKPWVLQQVWGSLKLAGVEFPSRAEAEFAIALHWLVVHVLTPGTGGIDTIDEALKAMRSKPEAT